MSSVTKYSTQTAVLTLEHNHPPGNLVQAQVDANLLVTTMKSGDTQIGEWVNVMGYVTTQRSKQASQETPLVGVQGIMLWSSGPFDLQAYERNLDHKDNKERPCG